MYPPLSPSTHPRRPSEPRAQQLAHPPLLAVGFDAAHVSTLTATFGLGGLVNPVLPCPTIESAVRLVRHGHRSGAVVQPAVVLAALDLPDGTAADVLGMLRGHLHLRRTPVIVVGQDGDDARISEVYQLGATAYLSEHVAPSVLLEVIRDLGTPWALGIEQSGS